jgi:hypothetical protein
MGKLVFLLPWTLLLSACASQPERVAKDFTQAVSEGDTARALESVDPEIRKQSGPKLTFLLDAAARESDARGGLKSVATQSVSERGDQARVRMTTVYHDGATETKIVRLRRVGGRWYLSV